MKTIPLLITIMFLLFCSCKEQIIQPPDEQKSDNINGSLNLALDMTNAPEAVVRLDGELYQGRGESINFDFNIENKSARAIVENVPSGEWTIRVDAYDNNDNVIYSGVKDIYVSPGIVTPVSLQLNPATGSLEITVTWGSSGPTSLAAYFPFSGNANDECGNGNHGVVMGAELTSDRFGNANSAYLFDGVDDEILLEDDTRLDLEGAITVCAWFKTEVSQWGALVCNFDQHGPDHGYELCVGSLYEDGGFIYFECAKDNVRDGLSTNESFNDGQWHFAVGVFAADGVSRRRIFVDGVEKFGYDNPLGGPINGLGRTPNYPFKIGATSNQEGPEGRSNFKGVIDEVRIYNGALSEVEIRGLYGNITDNPEDDNFEDNDTQAEATSLTEFTYYNDLSVFDSDDDWYAMHISADSLAITCDFSHSKGDINIELVDGNGNVLASSVSSTDDERIDYIVDELSTYYIHVYLESGENNSYTIWWDDIWKYGL